MFEETASINDVATWIAAKRFDILRWVDPVIGPSAELVGFDIWIGPKTHDYVSKCPWLRKRKGEKLCECAIYDLRPQVCRDFPLDLAHGKKAGCPACVEELPSGAGQSTEDPKPQRNDD